LGDPSVRRILTVLSIVALTARSLVPSGFMLAPVAPGTGAMTVVMCTGHGPQVLKLEADGKPIPAKPGKPRTELCAFVGFVLIDAPVVSGSALPADPYGTPVFFEPSDTTLPPVRAGPSVGSRAPPYLS
jgi:hypothetical protein